MPILEVEFDVYCSCGNPLCNQTEIVESKYKKGLSQVVIEPCERCLEKARDEGYDEGKLIVDYA